MHINARNKADHEHNFVSLNLERERVIYGVLIITILAMALEIVAGKLFFSMALLADGWHMATHAAAFSITIFSYYYVRKNHQNDKFAFGPGKITVLGGFLSAIILGLVAFSIMFGSFHRFFNPLSISFDQAIVVAIFGLVVNGICVVMLGEHHHNHSVEDVNHGHDFNYRAAYYHVLADALTSILAIIALTLGKYFGLIWLDPTMGMIGSLIILYWSYGLLQQTLPILLDASPEGAKISSIINTLENNSDDRVTDIHIWKISDGHHAGIISITSHTPKTPRDYKSMLSNFGMLDHLTIEVNKCLG